MNKAVGTVALSVGFEALGNLMPLYLVVDQDGLIEAAGPTVERIAASVTGRNFFDVMEVRRPRGVHSIADLAPRMDDPFHLLMRGKEPTQLRAVAVRLDNGRLLFNLSFGVGIAGAVARHGLTLSDFAVTDLAVEILYLIEAKTAANSETRRLISRLEDARSDAVARSMTDSLTGLPNRRGFEHHVLRLTDLGTDFAVMAIDLDHFKAVNDTHGHAVGDAVLKVAAERMSSTLREADIVARIGGDEFLAILQDVGDGSNLNIAGERLIDAMSAPIAVDGIVCRIGASVGIAIADGSAGVAAGAMIDRADDALYASKKAGRGVVTLAGHAFSENGDLNG